MFLRQRALQAEYCDRPDLTPADVADNYRQLTRFNRLVYAADPFTRLLVRWLGRQHVSHLSVLDLGAGDAALGEDLEAWAARRGWAWQVTSLDLNLNALTLRSRPRCVAASVCALPFRDATFDVVISSQMAHHLTDTDTVAHFREAWRVTRDALFLTDTHRNAGALCAVWVLLRTLRVTPHFLSDGLLSIRRGWRLAEWRALASQAGIPSPRVSLYYGTRVFLQARKQILPATTARREAGLA